MLTRVDWRTCRSHEACLIKEFCLSHLGMFQEDELEELEQWSLFGQLYMVGLTHSDPLWTTRYVDTEPLDYKQWYQHRWMHHIENSINKY